MHFNSNHDIKENCDLKYYFNKTDVTPSVLDGGQQIILANWPNYKRIICTNNNNIPVNIPSHPYVLLDRNILCNCDIEAESNFLLESLVACEDHEKPDLEMYFTVNLAFADYLEELNESIKIPIERNWANYRQTLSISLEFFQINSTLLQAPKTLQDFINQYQENRKIDNQRKIIQNSKIKTFINSVITDVLVFIAAILTLLIMFIIIYIIAANISSYHSPTMCKSHKCIKYQEPRQTRLQLRHVKISDDLELSNGSVNDPCEN